MNNEDKHLCPVCGKYEFQEYDSFEFCPICKWIDDAGLTRHPDLSGFYHMNLIEARQAYQNGQEIY